MTTGRKSGGAAYGRLDGLVRVPEPTVVFWLTKAASTALGEAVSDFSIRVMPPVLAVLIGFVLFAAALAWQLRQRRYVPETYWLAVAMVGVFGTMAADVVHVVLGLPYVASASLYALILVGVFLLWWSVEHDLSVHAVTTARRRGHSRRRAPTCAAEYTFQRQRVVQLLEQQHLPDQHLRCRKLLG